MQAYHSKLCFVYCPLHHDIKGTSKNPRFHANLLKKSLFEQKDALILLIHPISACFSRFQIDLPLESDYAYTLKPLFCKNTKRFRLYTGAIMVITKFARCWPITKMRLPPICSMLPKICSTHERVLAMVVLRFSSCLLGALTHTITYWLKTNLFGVFNTPHANISKAFIA
jgi:hypothetical protein